MTDDHRFRILRSGREPLVLFVIVGALLYGLWVAFAPPERGVVRVEPEALRALESRQEEIFGRPLTDEERADVREGYIEDEVLLREALRRGLQWSDGRVRQRLIRMVRGAVTPTVPDPSVAQLQAWYRENLDRFTSPESVSLEQVFFAWGEDVSDEELAEVLAQLRAGADPESFGQSTMGFGGSLPRRSRRELALTFGGDFADAVFPLPAGEWQGPFESIQGVHLVRARERHPPEPAEFEAIEKFVRDEWTMVRTRELQQERIDEMRANYRIEIVSE